MEETGIVVGIFKISKGRCKSIKQFINKSKSPGSAWQHGWLFENLSSEWIPICSGSGQHPPIHHLLFSIHIHGRRGHRYLTLAGTHNRISIWPMEMVTPLDLLHFPRPSHPIYLAAVLFACLHPSGRLGEGQEGYRFPMYVMPSQLCSPNILFSIPLTRHSSQCDSYLSMHRASFLLILAPCLCQEDTIYRTFRTRAEVSLMLLCKNVSAVLMAACDCDTH